MRHRPVPLYGAIANQDSEIKNTKMKTQINRSNKGIWILSFMMIFLGMARAEMRAQSFTVTEKKDIVVPSDQDKMYVELQGGDGGMEYPLATMITGNRPLNSLVGVAVHEQLHSWYQMILGSNESLYAWMDEGFTSYAESIVENELAREGLVPGKSAEENPFAGAYSSYTFLAKSGKEEPMTTHADHFNTNFAYSLAAYVKGAVFLNQMEYIIGKDVFDRGLLTYFKTWRFKHPNANDVTRVFEKESGLELDWYKEDWVNTTNA